MIKASLTRRPLTANDGQEAAEQALRGFGMALSAHASDRFLDLNLTIPQMRIIRTVGRLGRASGRQLADEFGVSPAAIVPVCDRLESSGFLRRVRDTEDRRICWFELTKSGAKTLDMVSSSIHAHVKPALAKLSYADRARLVAILDTLTKALNDSIRQAG
jgi:DNA-binding MarR family transcriptional regulator